MLIPYPLEPPPPAPPLDDPWDPPPIPCGEGRRVWTWGDQVGFVDGAALERLAVLGPLELRDRRVVALEEPLFVWEVEGEGQLQLMAEVEFLSDRVHYERADDGSRLWLSAEDPVDELLVSCYGGTVEARQEGEVIRLHATGEGRVRLALVGAWSDEDRDRTLRALTRKGVAGVIAQQLRHADMIARLGVRISTPDPEVGAALEARKRRSELELQELRGGHRSLLAPAEVGPALLAFGLREPVRDTLRAPLEVAARRRLFGYYGKWVGVDDFVKRHWARLMEEVRTAERGYRTFEHEDGRWDHLFAAIELLPLAEALGDRDAVETLEGVALAMEEDPRLPPPEDDVVATELDRWHLMPNAVEGVITIAPELPAEWPEMIVERLRLGDTSLDVRVRRTRSGVAMHVRVTRGPLVVVHLAPLLPFVATGILVGDEQLPGPTVRLVVGDEVDALWLH